MNEKRPPKDSIRAALDLDGDPDSVRAYYARWADTYDNDVAGDYAGTTFIGEVLAQFIDSDPDRRAVDRASLEVADVGCGTGLVARGLANLGFRIIDGMDISPEMVARARETGLYRELHAPVDINAPVLAEWHARYDVSICCGVFTLGHVTPEALYALIALTRRGGLVVVSTRTSYYDATDYQAVSDRIEYEGVAELKQCLHDAPYTRDGDAHYWVYEVL